MFYMGSIQSVSGFIIYLFLSRKIWGGVFFFLGGGVFPISKGRNVLDFSFFSGIEMPFTGNEKAFKHLTWNFESFLHMLLTFKIISTSY